MKDIKLYSPLSIQIDDANYNYHNPPEDYTDDDYQYYDDDAMVDLPESEYINFTDDINQQLSKRLGESCNLAKYCHNKELTEKLNSIDIRVVELEDQLYAETTVYIEDGVSISDADICDIKEHLISQFSDGFGESFEQIPVITNDGDIFVSLWSPNNWELSTNSPEISEKCNSEQVAHKPDAPMIGADGNIFGQMAIAKRALIDNGQDYVVKEMVSRVMDSESYDGALRVICEYVTPVDKKEYDRSKARKTKPRER